MKNVEIPKKETKEKKMLLSVTPTEHKNIMAYCRKRNVKFSDLIRFALKQTYDL